MTDLSKDILARDLKEAAQTNRQMSKLFQGIAESARLTAKGISDGLNRLAETNDEMADAADARAAKQEHRLESLGYK